MAIDRSSSGAAEKLQQPENKCAVVISVDLSGKADTRRQLNILTAVTEKNIPANTGSGAEVVGVVKDLTTEEAEDVVGYISHRVILPGDVELAMQFPDVPAAERKIAFVRTVINEEVEDCLQSQGHR
jgi:hypothetical protein